MKKRYSLALTLLVLALVPAMAVAAPRFGAKPNRATGSNTIATLASSPNPSHAGREVTLTASVLPDSATGDVTFLDGADTLGTATLSAGIASVTSAALGAGGHWLTASYTGDDVFAASVSEATIQTVLPDSTTLVLATSPSPSLVGGAVLLTATLSPSGAGGSVEFRNGVTSLGMATLSAGVATLSVQGLCGGTYSLAADYAGDASHYPSTAPAIVHVVDPAPTTVAVVSSLEPSRPGQEVSFTAHVDTPVAACPLTGSVQFVVDGVPYGAPVALSGDSATLGDITGLAAGTHGVVAIYSGSSSFQPSTSPAIAQAVVRSSTSTSLAATPDPTRFRLAVTLTATVTPDSATGAVTFKDGADTLGTATLAAGVATLTTSALSVGEHLLLAAYAGNGGYEASVSSVSPLTVLPDSATTLVLGSSPSPSMAGDAVLLTATISPPGTGGSVEFREGGTSLGTSALHAGVATLSVPGLCGGSYSLTAVYAGYPGYVASTSAPLEHVVNPARTTIAVVSSLGHARPGQTVSFTATVSDSADNVCALTGTVQFVIDALPHGSPVALAAGSATLGGITSLAPGSHAVHAIYSGSASFEGSTSPAIAQSVVPDSSSVALGSAPNPSRFGHAVTLTATVTPDSATGAVTFKDGADTLGTATLAGGVATVTTVVLGVGEHSLTAAYAGNDVYAASGSAALAHTVLPDSTTLALASAPNPSVVGSAVVLTATVSPAGAGGSVEFRSGAASLGTAALSAGVATLSVPGLCGGSYSLSAVYAGDSGHYAGTSAAHVHVVGPAPTTVAVVSSQGSTRLGQAVGFTATVSDSAAACALTGTVQFVIDSVSFGPPVALSAGSATMSGITSLAIGSHSVFASFSGNASFQPGTSPAITQDVESPRPVLVGVRDVLNDQGGKVKLLWNASYLDLAPYDSIATYWILRSAPSTAAARARQAGARVSRPGETPDPQVGAFAAVQLQGTTYYWEYVASQPAFHVANYSYVAATTCDSIAGSNPLTAFMIMARTANGAQWWFSDPDSGYSVDNLAPHTPTAFTGAYAAGKTTLHWARNTEADLGQYRLYRGSTAGFAPAEDNFVAARTDTGYVDVTGVLYYYKLCAVDVHGNVSGFAPLLPSWTAGVEDGAPLAFALEGVRPNPTRCVPLSVAFTLPVAAAARLELLDVSGRRVAEREVGVLGAGRHSVALSADPRLAPGLYLVRLTQGTNVRVARVAVLQ